MPVTHWEWHHLTKYKAWTVRADLWPAGTGAYVQGVAMLSCEYYAHRADRTGDHRVVQYSLPGVAEALVLQGLVAVSPGPLAQSDWDLIPCWPPSPAGP